MCGIFGIVQLKNKFELEIISQNKVRESAVLMYHRGPDAYGQWGIKDKIELAHLRLSIIDTTPESNQPFFSECGNFIITFNGEIYNYIEIKSELQIKGHSFRTKSDTEVLLNSYIEWGDECVTRFNGDWAFAIAYAMRKRYRWPSLNSVGVRNNNRASDRPQPASVAPMDAPRRVLSLVSMDVARRRWIDRRQAGGRAPVQGTARRRQRIV